MKKRAVVPVARVERTGIAKTDAATAREAGLAQNGCRWTAWVADADRAGVPEHELLKLRHDVVFLSPLPLPRPSTAPREPVPADDGK